MTSPPAGQEVRLLRSSLVAMTAPSMSRSNEQEMLVIVKFRPRARIVAVPAPKGGQPMKISYDKELDALYIRLLDGDFECRNVVLTDEITLDFGPAEQLVGIEILDATRVLGQGKLPQVVVDHLPVVAA
jgi:uncharacterized protein YuzE